MQPEQNMFFDDKCGSFEINQNEYFVNLIQEGNCKKVAKYIKSQNADISNDWRFIALYISVVDENLELCKILFNGLYHDVLTLEKYQCLLPATALKVGNLEIFKYFVSKGFTKEHCKDYVTIHNYSDLEEYGPDCHAEYRYVEDLKLFSGYEFIKNHLWWLKNVDKYTSPFGYDNYISSDYIPHRRAEKCANYILGSAVKSGKIESVCCVLGEFGFDRENLWEENLACIRWAIDQKQRDMISYIVHKLNISREDFYQRIITIDELQNNKYAKFFRL